MNDSDLHWEDTANPTEIDLGAVDDGLHAYNLQAADVAVVKPAACFVRDGAGRVVGGVRARTWGTACEVQQLWVDEAWRRRGIGLALMQRIEALVRTRGVRTMYLDTFSWQAPRLYRRAGFVVAYEVTGFPDGATKFLLIKELPVDASEAA
jgi:GNAT superfamily N-acetyltransferase